MRTEAEIIIEARKKMGLTQQQVADKAKIGLRHYQMFECGERKLSSSNFWTTCNVLDVLELDVAAFAHGAYAVKPNN